MSIGKACATISIVNYDKASFSVSNPISREEALKLNPMSLAFVGDGVQSLYTRTLVTVGSRDKTGLLHKEVTKVVKAVSQAAAAQKLMELFDEDERDVFRRARNSRIQTSAKHAKIGQYRMASGLEAVFGFLYLTGAEERLNLYLKIAAFEAEEE